MLREVMRQEIRKHEWDFMLSTLSEGDLVVHDGIEYVITDIKHDEGINFRPPDYWNIYKLTIDVGGQKKQLTLHEGKPDNKFYAVKIGNRHGV